MKDSERLEEAYRAIKTDLWVKECNDRIEANMELSGDRSEVIDMLLDIQHQRIRQILKSYGVVSKSTGTAGLESTQSDDVSLDRVKAILNQSCKER